MSATGGPVWYAVDEPWSVTWRPVMSSAKGMRTLEEMDREYFAVKPYERSETNGEASSVTGPYASKEDAQRMVDWLNAEPKVPAR